MKKFSRYLLILSYFFLNIYAGCTHDGSQIVTPVNNPTPPTAGNWIINYYTDNGSDVSQKINGYIFAFNSDGSLVVTNGSSVVNGSWKTGADDSKPKMTLTLPGANSVLEELAEDWIIKLNTATEIDLTKDGGHAREVHFIKQ